MNDENTPKDSAKMGEAITPDEFSDILEEIENQPVWRSRADKEMDYYDGNQLKSELLEKQKALGIPPAVENVIQPAINALIGMEAKTRKDWRVSPDGDPQGQDVADALNYKLNQAERHSGADVACGEAFKTEAGAGIGWVEPRRESDPFKYPYKCSAVHRNEIYWDMKGKEPDTTDWRWLGAQEVDAHSHRIPDVQEAQGADRAHRRSLVRRVGFEHGWHDWHRLV
jgi:hypothetical protein